jgi:hypothetical protein
VSGPRTTLAVVCVLLVSAGALGFSLGRDAERILRRSTADPTAALTGRSIAPPLRD